MYTYKYDASEFSELIKVPEMYNTILDYSVSMTTNDKIYSSYYDNEKNMFIKTYDMDFCVYCSKRIHRWCPCWKGVNLRWVKSIIIDTKYYDKINKKFYPEILELKTLLNDVYYDKLYKIFKNIKNNSTYSGAIYDSGSKIFCNKLCYNKNEKIEFQDFLDSIKNATI